MATVEGLSFLSTLRYRRVELRRDAARRVDFREAATRQRQAAEVTAARHSDTPRQRNLRVAAWRREPQTVSQDATKSGHRHIRAVASCQTRLTVVRCKRSCTRYPSRRGRSVDVNAAVIGSSGPGIWTAAIVDAPFSRRGRDLESVDPLRAGQEHRTGRHARHGLLMRVRPTSGSGQERGFNIGTALSKRSCQTRLETAGPHLNALGTRPAG